MLNWFKLQADPNDRVHQEINHWFFDSHFHLDRTARELWGVREVSTVTLDDILREPLVPAPNNPVTRIGGVIVFCDPGTIHSITLMDRIQR